MTDKLHYQDLFKTINIPETEKNLAFEAEHLFAVANGVEPWDETVFAHMSKFIDTESASQIFWNYENDDHHTYDRLAFTAMRSMLTIAFEHRDFDHSELGIRKTLTLSNGKSRLYVTDIARNGRIEASPSSDLTSESFKKDFYAVSVANLGLAAYIERMKATQNESDAAIFANAA
jgi:hypothetical protein